jgi:putative CocE/NonD family hydrolase
MMAQIRVKTRTVENKDSTGEMIMATAHRHSRATRGLRLATALLLAGSATSALAQDVAASDSDEGIIVTGSRIARSDAASVGPITTLTQDDILYTAPTSVGDLIQALPGVGVSLNNNGTQGTAFGVSSVNLRYLGSAEGSGNRTLVLVDGKRWINAVGGRGFRDFVDLNTVPMGIVDNIEVLKDGASAIYGADAIAGVVNIKTKRKIDGIDANVRFGITDRGDNENITGHLNYGKTSERFSFLVSLNYANTKPILTMDRPLTVEALTAPTAPTTSPRGLFVLPGVNNNAFFGTPANFGQNAANAFQSGIRQGGAYELKQLTWALKHARLSPLTTADPARKAALDAVDLTGAVDAVPWQPGSSPLAAAPEYEAYVLALWRETSFTPFWQQPALYALGYHHQFPDVPMVHMSSWYDPYALTAIENFTGLSRPGKAPVRLLLGPWTHGQRSVSHAGAVDFGTNAPLDGTIADDYISLRRAFFDHHLKGMGADPLPRAVNWFRMGGGPGTRTPEGRLAHGGAWQAADSWPPPEVRLQPLWLAADRRLLPEPPQAAGHAVWTHDPCQPVPSIGGAIASGAPLMHAGAYDQREQPGWFAHHHPGQPLAGRADVLIFETPPLTEAVEVTGQFEALLHVASSAEDTDLMLKLVDVHPDSADWPQGFAMNLAHGVLRLSFRHGFEAPRALVPGEIMPIRIKGFPTSNLFLPGHRIRLEIASSNFPHFDINTGCLPPATSAKGLRVAHNRLHFSAEHPSHILLPMMPATRTL